MPPQAANDPHWGQSATPPVEKWTDEDWAMTLEQSLLNLEQEMQRRRAMDVLGRTPSPPSESSNPETDSAASTTAPS